MILHYKASVPGPRHLDQGTPCQDAFSVRYAPDGRVFAACADGLGSERFSDIGAKIAAGAATAYCLKHLDRKATEQETLRTMRRAFIQAYRTVLRRAMEMGNAFDEYDTTLCMGIYDGTRLYFGQSGDSGMVAVLTSGEYIRVTEQQRDADGCVYPLCFGPEKWVFGSIGAPVSAFLLATDGMLEQICPPILRGEKKDVNVPLARFFLQREEREPEAVRGLDRSLRIYLRRYPRANVDDDKTIVVAYNPEQPARLLDPAYYTVDWEKALRRRNHRLYPAAGGEDPPS